MNFNDFQKILWQQKASGEDGFEGLVAKLLEKLTGQRFYLSLSGRQEGKDMSSSGQHGNLLAVECKRYKDSTSFKPDELLAKFAAAHLTQSPPDLWMVVTTKSLGEQHHDQLKRASQEFGIAYFSVDAKGDEDSFLCALCAHAPDIVANHLNNLIAFR